MTGYIQSDQVQLFGQPDVVGFGADDFHVRTLPKSTADDLILANHYSGTVATASQHHLGVFAGGDLVGVLQFGPAMNPASGGKIVAGSDVRDWLELNRMWLSPDAPTHAASRAVSYAVKYLRRVNPRLAWIQSFADERCGGKLGAVYQACSFLFLGMHRSTFYCVEGQWFHQLQHDRATGKTTDKACNAPRVRWLRARLDQCEKHTFRQYRYVRIVKRWARKALRLPVLPYPKPDPPALDDVVNFLDPAVQLDLWS